MTREELNAIIAKNIQTNNEGDITAVILAGVLYNLADYSEDLSEALAAALANYYLKTETYSRAEVNEMIAAIRQFRYVKVGIRPVASAETVGIVYLVPSDDPALENVCDEWITVGDDTEGYDWELIGSTAVDMEGYVTDEELADAIKDLMTGPVPMTRAALKALRDGGTLRPGQAYRITDYVATTKKASTKSAEHPFDIIVKALDGSTLSERAGAMCHTGDTYFKDSRLEAWDIRYCLDNDITRFDWAATTGKGVVYYMRDEFGNEAPFDFKGLLFLDSVTGLYVYTFSAVNYGAAGNVADISAVQLSDSYSDNAHVMRPACNKIGVSFDPSYYMGEDVDGFIQPLKLVANLFVCAAAEGSLIAPYNITLGPECYGNRFGNHVQNITLGAGANRNTIGYGCHEVTIGELSFSNKIGAGSYNVTIGRKCSSNTFGTEVTMTEIGDFCTNNTFGNGSDGNILDTECLRNTINGSLNKLAAYCQYVTIGANSIGNVFGARCLQIKLGSACNNNVFGAECKYISFNFTASQTGNYFYNNRFDAGVSYVKLVAAQDGTLPVYGYHVCAGVVGTNSAYETIEAERVQIASPEYYHETTVARGTSGAIVTYVIADSY